MSTIVLKNIEMTLDPQSIQKAIDEITLLEDGLKTALDRLCEELAKEGKEIARANIMRFNMHGDGYLLESIDWSEEAGVYYVTAGDETTEVEGYGGGVTNYAVFVEFGTGLVSADGVHPSYTAGKKNPDKAAEKAAKTYYNINNHDEKGWVYKDRHGKFHRTTGEPARPFMYNTYLELLDYAESNGGKIIAEYIP